MTADDVLYRYRLRALALAAELGNVRAACRALGIHHSTFYRWTQRSPSATASSCCAPASAARRAMPNQTSPMIEQRVLAFALAHPGYGPGADRRRAWPAQVGRRSSDQRQRGLGGAAPPRPDHPRQAPGAGGRLHRPARARPALRPRPVRHIQVSPARASWCRWTASSSAACRGTKGHRLAVHRHRRLLVLPVGRACTPAPATPRPPFTTSALAHRVAAAPGRARLGAWRRSAATTARSSPATSSAMSSRPSGSSTGASTPAGPSPTALSSAPS